MPKEHSSSSSVPDAKKRHRLLRNNSPSNSPPHSSPKQPDGKGKRSLCEKRRISDSSTPKRKAATGRSKKSPSEESEDPTKRERAKPKTISDCKLTKSALAHKALGRICGSKKDKKNLRHSNEKSKAKDTKPKVDQPNDRSQAKTHGDDHSQGRVIVTPPRESSAIQSPRKNLYKEDQPRKEAAKEPTLENIGSTVGPYTSVDKLGSGRFADVWVSVSIWFTILFH